MRIDREQLDWYWGIFIVVVAPLTTVGAVIGATIYALISRAIA